jgi:putative DNA primase/helicase
MRDAIDQFRAAIQSAGLSPPETIEPDGKLHRFASNGMRGDDAGWYALHDDGIPAGSFGDWRSGQSHTWRADLGRSHTPEDEAAHRAKVEAMMRERDAEKVREQAEAAIKAAAIWEAAKPAPNDHPYLVRKGIKPSGARLHNDALVIAMRSGGEIRSLQFIGPDGDKRFLTGGRATGCYFSMGTPKGAAALCVAEGFATGATIHEATGYPVAVAFNAANLGSVAKAMRDRFAELPLIICADDDVATEGNPGITKATEAARAVGGVLAIPHFGTERPQGATDFNDLAHLRGMQAVAIAIANVAAPTTTEAKPGTRHTTGGVIQGGGWPEPQPLAVRVEPEPYPLDALPDTVRAAVLEVQGFTKAPIPLVASSALAALSLAIQAHVDAKRAEKLHGPVGLFLLSIADSGERKSTCDRLFMQAIRDYDARQAEAAKPILKDYKAAIEAWDAERDGIVSAIKQAGRTAKPVHGKDISALRAELAEHQHRKAAPPRFPRLIYADATPEALAYGLAYYWPSGGVVSAEGGLVFGSHAMGKDSIMRNLAMLNQLWDGNHLTIDRRTTESFTVKGVRLTMALQVQEPTLREFFARSGVLARGTGFLARFLVAWPESTQGYRHFTEAPPNWPHLDAFNRRVAEILDQPAPINDHGVLAPSMLSLTAEAKAAWVQYHDAIESELASGGELYDVRDVASKTADNAIRLAALFQIFEGAPSTVDLDCFESGSRIAAWHLNESRRFLGELAAPVELANAARLDRWLIEYCKRERTHFVPIAKLQQGGPGGLRSKATIEAALRELEESSRARLVRDGKRRLIAVNPAVVIEGGAL